MSEKEQKQGWFKRNLSWIAALSAIVFLAVIPFYVFKFLPYIAKRAEVRIDAGISANIASYGVVLAALASVFTAFVLVLQWNEQRKQREFIAQQTDILNTQQKVIEEQLEMQREERFTLVFDKHKGRILAVTLKGIDSPVVNFPRGYDQDNSLVEYYKRELRKLEDKLSEYEKLFDRMKDLLLIVKSSNPSKSYKIHVLNEFLEGLDGRYLSSLFCYLWVKKREASDVLNLFREFSVFKNLKITPDWKEYFIKEEGVPEEVFK